jgi:REP element-mobilizing transposase RayT
MTRARSTLVSVDDTPWYHCVTRCVRRAFLCGEDRFTGKSYEHRRGWFEQRIKELAGIFPIDVAGYAAMSNHSHLIVRIDRERALGWSAEEVLLRWTALFSGPLLVRRYLSEQRPGMLPAEVQTVLEAAEVYRVRLYDLSWFMRTLNEDIARRANAEDGVKGRFWEGRFKSQALLDEQALLAALAYVDLNPIRAGIAETPETSDYTSIQERIAEISANEVSPQQPAPPRSAEIRKGSPVLKPAPLMPFDATGRTAWAIPFDFHDYLELVDWTGRAVRPDKRGSIPEGTPKLLTRLRIDPEGFIEYGAKMLKVFGTAVGVPETLANLCAKRQSRYLWGLRAARRLFPANTAA